MVFRWVLLSAFLWLPLSASAQPHSDEVTPGGNSEHPTGAPKAHPDDEALTKDTKDVSLKTGDLGDPKFKEDEGERRTTWGPFQGGEAKCDEARDAPCCWVSIFSPEGQEVKLPWGTELTVTKVRPKASKKERADGLGQFVVDLNLHFGLEDHKGFLACSLYSGDKNALTFGQIRGAVGKHLSVR